MRPFNDYILVLPDQTDDSAEGPILPDTSKYLHQGEILDVGADVCVMHFMEGGMTASTIFKDEISPGGKLEAGMRVMYRKVAEQRLTMDQSYRVRLADGRFALLLKLADIIAVV